MAGTINGQELSGEENGPLGDQPMCPRARNGADWPSESVENHMVAPSAAHTAQHRGRLGRGLICRAAHVRTDRASSREAHRATRSNLKDVLRISEL
jgi:hypothetical protein